MRYRCSMIPMKSKTIFTSRWWALLWAAGILWGVHDLIGLSKGDSDAAAMASADAGNAANISDDAQIAALSNTVNTLKAQ